MADEVILRVGSTRQLTNSSQTVTDSYLYDAWGSPVTTTGSTVNPFQYVGRLGYYADLDTLNYYIRARNYRPSIARWLSVDPLGFVDGMNRYKAYFIPSRVDPSGLQSDAEDPKEIIEGVINNLQWTGPNFYNCPYPDAGLACLMYVKLFDVIEKIYGNPFADLPCCPKKIPTKRIEHRCEPQLGSDFQFPPFTWIEIVYVNPDNTVWGDPGRPICCHAGASVCMRSIASPPYGGPAGIIPRQQCCYDGSGSIISTGEGAGAPDLSSGTLTHNRIDVASWACCRAANMIHMYNARWKPNTGC